MACLPSSRRSRERRPEASTSFPVPGGPSGRKNPLTTSSALRKVSKRRWNISVKIRCGEGWSRGPKTIPGSGYVGRTLLSVALEVGLAFASDLCVGVEGKTNINTNGKGDGQECPSHRSVRPTLALYFLYMSGVPQQAPRGNPQKTFYLETFGCQMNVHDSEKVSGRSCRKAIDRSRASSRPTWCSTTRARSATRRSRKCSTASPITRNIRSKARRLVCSAASRSRKAKRFSSARLTCRWWRDRRRTVTCRRCCGSWRRLR